MKISVITVCKNSQQTIEKAIQSVLSQKNTNKEYIIIDGSSTDETLSIIKNYRNDIDVFISERDAGIYNAMNKGLNYSSGDIVYFLNSDDYLYNETVISDVLGAFEANKESEIIYGNIVMFDDKRQWLVRYSDVDRKFFYKHTICHQAVFAKKTLFKKVGNFDEKYRIHADIDWLMKVFFNLGNVFKYYDRTICFFSAKGFCSDPINADRYKFDRQEISAKYFMEAKFKLMVKKLLRGLGIKL